LTDLALVRGVPRSIVGCELSFVERQPIDYLRAVDQHRAYVRALAALGLEPIELPADHGLPD
jgi:dimethylargininase